MKSGLEALRREREALTAWLIADALPLWWRADADRVNGGFFEQIGQDGRAIDGPRRVRVTARQIFSFARGRELGWNGPAEAIEHGLDFLLGKARAERGYFHGVVEPDGKATPDFDLYDNAFALFGLAAACRAGIRPNACKEIAKKTLATLRAGWTNPSGGFAESLARVPPLKANPHMHLLEAALAWIEIEPADGGWNALADEIAGLCLARFILPENGCVREYFDEMWNPAAGDAGRIVEPGHQFEWAWLLVRWGRQRNRIDALVAARTLVALGERHGVDPRRGVAFAEMWSDLRPKDLTARLWPQTERIRGWLAIALQGSQVAEVEQALHKAAAAAAVLRSYLDTPVRGLWRDRMDENGKFIEEPAPASSLYHIVGAISEMQAATRELQGTR